MSPNPSSHLLIEAARCNTVPALHPGAGKLSIICDPGLRSKFEHAASKEELVQLTDSFVDAIRRGR